MTGTATSGTVTLVALHVEDETIVDGWLAMLAASAADNPDSPPPCPTDMVGSLRFAPPATVLDDWVAVSDGRVVGSLRLALPDGAPTARVDQLLVHPSARRRGIGRRLVAHAVERATAHGRDALTTTLVEQIAGGPERDDGPAAFAATVGAESPGGGSGLHQILDLQVHDPLVDGVPPVPGGYHLVTWGTVTPEEFAVRVSALEQSLGGADPDELEASATVENSYARRFETMRIGRGRRAYHTGVVHEASGKLVGYTSISMTAGNPHHALQGMTVVQNAHRGHGLGRVLKLANLDRVRRTETALRLVETTNDAANDAMIAVNAAMGFVPRERWVGRRLPV